MKAWTKISRVFDRIIYGFFALAGVLLVFAFLFVNSEIVMRYFLGKPILWVIPITEYILLFITFMGAAWVLKKEGHIKMDLVLNWLKPGTRAMANAVISIICALALLPYVRYGLQVVWDYYQRGVTEHGVLGTPEAAILFLIPLGGFLFFIQFLIRAGGFFRSWKEHKEVDEGFKVTPPTGV